MVRWSDIQLLHRHAVLLQPVSKAASANHAAAVAVKNNHQAVVASVADDSCLHALLDCQQIVEVAAYVHQPQLLSRQC